MEEKNCCVPHCCGKENFIKFPNPTLNLDTFKAWISFIGVDPSEYADDYGKIYLDYEKKQMCNLHFTPMVCQISEKGNFAVTYTVPHLYGPEFWNKKKKNILARLNKPDKESELIQKKRKRTSNYELQTKPKPHLTTERMLIPRIERIEDLLKSEVIPEELITYQHKIHVNTKVSPQDATSSSKNATSSPGDSKILKMTEAHEEDEIVTNSDEYEVEYLDSDEDKTDCESNTLIQEIEYLDMDKLEFDDNLPQNMADNVQNITPNISTPHNIKVKSAQNTIMDDTLQHAPNAIKTYTRKLDGNRPQNTADNVQNITPNISTIHNFIVISPQNTIMDDKLQHAPNAFKTYTRRPKPQPTNVIKKPASRVKPVLDVDSVTGCVTIKLVYEENEKNSKELDNATLVEPNDQPVQEIYNTSELNDQPVQEVYHTSNLTQARPKPQPKKLPIQPASIFKPVSNTGCVIKLENAENEPNSNDLDNTKLVEPNEQPVQEVCHTPNLTQAKKPITKKPLEIGIGNPLQEFMKKHNLTPIDSKNPLHEHVTATMSELENEHNVKLPVVDISSPDLQQLAARMSQNTTDSNLAKKTKVYVLDSKGSILIEEQLDTAAIRQMIQQKPVENSKFASATKPQMIQQKPVENSKFASATKPQIIQQKPVENSKFASATKPQMIQQKPVENSKCTSVTKPQIKQQKPVENSKFASATKPQMIQQKPVENISAPTEQKQAPRGSYNDFKTSVSLQCQSAKERALKRELKNFQNRCFRYKKMQAKLRLRLKQAKNPLNTPKFIEAVNNMPRIARMITTIQLRENIKPVNGRRYTEEERELALSLHKECPSAYKYMVKMGFSLPTQFRDVDHIKSNVESAINENDGISKLKAKVEKMPTEHRVCVLLFDEKLISPANRKNRVVTAVGSQGEAEASFEADHALIFMIKGILKDYQEPVSYTFSFGPTNGRDLALHIKSVIANLQVIGYIVLATICDQADNNRLAIELLTNEARCYSFLTSNDTDTVFKVNDQEIIPLYDCPHLLRGIRNHLISKYLIYELDGELRTAQWQHFEMMLNENPEYKGERVIRKLTIEHVYPTKQTINVTKYASQLFSQTVAVYMGYLAERNILPPESRNTADLILFLDQLFDSVNGSLSNTPKDSKPLLSAVKPKSPHQQLWLNAIQILRTMKFVNNETVVPVPDLDCWVSTLQGYILLVQKLFINYKAKSVWMRNLNQDVLEELFRTDVNPGSKVRTKMKKKPKNPSRPGRYPGEVVTQKVLKTIHRLNMEKPRDGEVMKLNEK